jgi:hypothetical protein
MIQRQREFLRTPFAQNLVGQKGGNSTRTEEAKSGTFRSVEPIAALQQIASVPGARLPVENAPASDATVAPDDNSAWHGATVASPATVAPDTTAARYATVKGELRVPNTINFSLFPTLDPFAKAIYYQLFLQSHGFRRDTCVVSLEKLANSVLMSRRKVQNTITYLEKRGLVIRLRPVLGGSLKGNVYQVLTPVTDVAAKASTARDATLAPDATVALLTTVAPPATNKYDDDDLKENHHQRSLKSVPIPSPVENHSGAAAPRERHENRDNGLVRVRTAYENATGNRWNKADSAAFEENGIEKIPVNKIISVLETVTQRTPAKVNSFNYFVKEIVAIPDQRRRAWHKKQFEEIVYRLRENAAGRADYTSIDFLEDVKCACAREGVVFDNDLFNDLVKA